VEGNDPMFLGVAPMARTWTKTEAFEHFGALLTNARWSWSGISPDGLVVAIVLWKDAVRPQGGRFVYVDDDDLDAEWRRRPGHAERVRHLAHCREELGGRFRAVIARAKDEHTDPREIAACYPQQGVWWEIDEFDEASGAFSAHAVGTT
jgi:hypothetical protein